MLIFHRRHGTLKTKGARSRGNTRTELFFDGRARGKYHKGGKLAAHYSKNSGAEKVEVDYVEKKQVKKPNGSKPGFVVYYTNYSMMIDSDISGIQEVQ